MRKGVLRNFTKFTEKHLCLRPATFIKKETLTQVFPATFAKSLRTPFLENTSGRQLLLISQSEL